MGTCSGYVKHSPRSGEHSARWIRTVRRLRHFIFAKVLTPPPITPQFGRRFFMSIVNNIFWSKYATKMIFGAMNRIWPTFYRWNSVKKWGRKWESLILNRKLSASMKKWVKISTSKRFLDYPHIENGPTMVRESRPHFRPLFQNTFRWISTQYQSSIYENVLFFQLNAFI